MRIYYQIPHPIFAYLRLQEKMIKTFKRLLVKFLYFFHL